MLNAHVKKLLIIVISSLLLINDSKADLANLSITLLNLTNRANELGLLTKTTSYKINPSLSDDLNQILASLETKQIAPVLPGDTYVSKTIKSLLQLFIDDYEIKDDTISFEYQGFKLSSPIEQFSNELLLLANLADYVSTNFAQNSIVKILSNTFNNPVLYLFLNSILLQEDIKLDLTIIGGILEPDSEKLIKRISKASKIQYYVNSLRLKDNEKRKLSIDIYLLNPKISIDHLKNHMVLCTKTVDDKLNSIKIYPKHFDNTFLLDSFAAVDQVINKSDLTNFWKTLILQTINGPKAFKDLMFDNFSCNAKPSNIKMITDIIYSTRNKLKTRLFLFAQNKVVSLDFTSNNITTITDLFGSIYKATANLQLKKPNINAHLTNNIRFYTYDKAHKKFNKYKSINSIDIKAIDLSDKM